MKKMNKKNPVTRISLLVISILMVTSAGLSAWDGEDVPIDTIRPVSEFRPFYAENRDKIQRGRLITMGGDSALIDGKRMRISSNASFLEWNGETKRKIDFVFGSLVAFKVDESGNVIALWDLSPESMPFP